MKMVKGLFTLVIWCRCCSVFRTTGH